MSATPPILFLDQFSTPVAILNTVATRFVGWLKNEKKAGQLLAKNKIVAIELIDGQLFFNQAMAQGQPFEAVGKSCVNEKCLLVVTSFASEAEISAALRK